MRCPALKKVARRIGRDVEFVGFARRQKLWCIQPVSVPGPQNSVAQLLSEAVGPDVVKFDNPVGVQRRRCREQLHRDWPRDFHSFVQRWGLVDEHVATAIENTLVVRLLLTEGRKQCHQRIARVVLVSVLRLLARSVRRKDAISTWRASAAIAVEVVIDVSGFAPAAIHSRSATGSLPSRTAGSVATPPPAKPRPA